MMKKCKCDGGGGKSEKGSRCYCTKLTVAGVTKKHQQTTFEYWVFSQRSYLNMGRFENNIFAYLKFNICIPKIWYLLTK